MSAWIWTSVREIRVEGWRFEVCTDVGGSVELARDG